MFFRVFNADTLIRKDEGSKTTLGCFLSFGLTFIEAAQGKSVSR